MSNKGSNMVPAEEAHRGAGITPYDLLEEKVYPEPELENRAKMNER